jgi:hypothetical protein
MRMKCERIENPHEWSTGPAQALFFFLNQHLYPTTCIYDKDVVPKGTGLVWVAKGGVSVGSVWLDGWLVI